VGITYGPQLVGNAVFVTYGHISVGNVDLPTDFGCYIRILSVDKLDFSCSALPNLKASCNHSYKITNKKESN